MKIRELLEGRNKNALIGILMLISFFILLPTFIKVIHWQMAPYTENEVVITSTFYISNGLNDENGVMNVITCDLFQPSPKFSDKKYPAIIACHGDLMGIGKESMNSWCVEIAKRGFVVLSIDLPGYGMSTGEVSILPRDDLETVIIEDGIIYLKSLSFVNDSSIGLVGLGYGGTVASMSAGKIPNLVNATVSLNALTNFTSWMIEEILPSCNIDFIVNSGNITLNKIGNIAITNENILDFLKLYNIVRGNGEDIENLIIEGTTSLNRTFLRKFDAVESLSNARNNSVMFIHSSGSTYYGTTNQSGQGYDSIIASANNATFLQVNGDDHFFNDPNYHAYYCTINFLEEKLKNVDLGSGSEFAKYTQQRDIVLTFVLVFGFELLYECIVTFIISLIPLFLIVSILVYNKKIATERALNDEKILEMKRNDKNFIDFSLGRGSYAKTLFFLTSLYLIGYSAILGMAYGVISDLIAGTLCALYYLVFILTLYYLPDQAEVDTWKRLKKANQKNLATLNGSDINDRVVPLILIGFILCVALIGIIPAFIPNIFNQPFESLLTSMLLMGLFLIFGGIIVIFALEKQRVKEFKINIIQWSVYDLDKYQIIKSFTFGSVLFVSSFFQWNIWAFFLKFPTRIAPHTVYFSYMVISVLIFFGGIQLLIKILKVSFLKDHLERLLKKKIRNMRVNSVIIELIAVLCGILILLTFIFVTFTTILNTTLFGNFVVILLLVFLLSYITSTAIKAISVDRGIFGVSIFIPLAIFTIIAFFMQI